jgi:hypothetical protein
MYRYSSRFVLGRHRVRISTDLPPILIFLLFPVCSNECQGSILKHSMISVFQNFTSQYTSSYCRPIRLLQLKRCPYITHEPINQQYEASGKVSSELLSVKIFPFLRKRYLALEPWFLCLSLNNFVTDRQSVSWFGHILCFISVGIALGYGLDDRSSRVRFPVGAGNFSLHHRVQNGSGAHPAPYPMGTRGLSLGVKRPGRETDHCRGQRMSGAILPLHQYAFMVWCSVKARISEIN